MSYLRSDIRTEVRDNLYETTADLFTNDQLNRCIRRVIRRLPRHNIYLEEIHTTTTVVDQLDYVLPTGTLEVELVERNWGTASKPDWKEEKGWQAYGGVLYLSERPTVTWTLRAHLRKSFTDLSDDVATSDIPDDKMEVVVWGASVEAYKLLMGYFTDAKNWDAIAKPDGISMNQIVNWLKDAREMYKDAIKLYKTVPKPRDIDLVG